MRKCFCRREKQGFSVYALNLERACAYLFKHTHLLCVGVCVCVDLRISPLSLLVYACVFICAYIV